MAKKAAKMTDTLELVKPYLERALKDEDFRKDLKDALAGARELYGTLAKQNSGRAPRALRAPRQAERRGQLREGARDRQEGAGADAPRDRRPDEPQGHAPG